MTTAVIIDDEQKGRVALREKLRSYCPEIRLIGEASDGLEGLKLVEEQHPTIVFLDIEMPHIDGFEMLHRLQRKDFHIIFTTAYDKYAIKAIKYAAFDYLLKPIDIEELRDAIARVKKQSQQYTGEKLEVLRKSLMDKNYFDKIGIPTLEGLLFFNTNDIIHLEAQSNYTSLFFKDHPTLLASRTLKDFEELLPSDTFFRTHHSHIINLQYIKRYIRGDGGQIEMQNGDYIIVSRRKKEEFLNRIKNQI